jgi:hypothetical protein
VLCFVRHAAAGDTLPMSSSKMSISIAWSAEWTINKCDCFCHTAQNRSLGYILRLQLVLWLPWKHHLPGFKFFLTVAVRHVCGYTFTTQ